jgi:hypothetical protein
MRARVQIPMRNGRTIENVAKNFIVYAHSLVSVSSRFNGGSIANEHTQRVGGIFTDPDIEIQIEENHECVLRRFRRAGMRDLLFGPLCSLHR